MDCPESKKTKRGEVAVACPPDDSLVEILSRLPAKPLFRSKCVSKDWCELIADHLRCRRSPQTLGGFFSGGRAKSYGGFINLSERPVPFVDPSFSFLTKLPEIENIVLLGSCNGLVLFEHRRVSDCDDSLGYIVCNPATEQWVSVPSFAMDDSEDVVPEDEDYEEDYESDNYLTFDPAISPHFQLIQIQYKDGEDELYTFSSATGEWDCWMRLDEDEEELYTHFLNFLHISGVFPSSGMMYAIMRPISAISSEHKDMLVAVNRVGRPKTLDWPASRGEVVFVGQSQGRLHCLSGHMDPAFPDTELSIWVLDDNDAETWVLRDNVSFSQLFKRMWGSRYAYWDVVCIHPDRGLVFFVEYWNWKLISYDMDKKEVCALHTLGHDYRLGETRTLIPYVPYFADSVALAKNQ